MPVITIGSKWRREVTMRHPRTASLRMAKDRRNRDGFLRRESTEIPRTVQGEFMLQLRAIVETLCNSFEELLAKSQSTDKIGLRGKQTHFKPRMLLKMGCLPTRPVRRCRGGLHGWIFGSLVSDGSPPYRGSIRRQIQ
jgi:hypothetical protein